MTGRTACRAFTLVELMAVVALLAVGISVATLNTRTLSDGARVRAAASQIGSFYRLIHCAAMRTGTPRIMVFDANSCTARKPVLVEEEWTWSTATEIRLVSGVRLLDVRRNAASTSPRTTGGPWYVTVKPGLSHSDLRLRIGTGAVQATAVVDAITGAVTLTDESDE